MVRSGTEEEYTCLHKLLQDIASYQEDFAKKVSEKKSADEEKKQEDKRKGEEMRNAAMNRLSSKFSMIIINYY